MVSRASESIVHIPCPTLTASITSRPLTQSRVQHGSLDEDSVECNGHRALHGALQRDAQCGVAGAKSTRKAADAAIAHAGAAAEGSQRSPASAYQPNVPTELRNTGTPSLGGRIKRASFSIFYLYRLRLMPLRFLVLALCGGAAALSLNGGAATRRSFVGAISTTAIGAQVPAAFASVEGKEAAKAAAAARKAAEEAAALPINQLKTAREQLASVAPFLENQEWYELRTVLQTPPLLNVRTTALKGAGKSAEVIEARAQYLADLTALDTFAYNEQRSPRVLRGCVGPCLNNEQLEPARVSLKKTLGDIDAILKLCK